MVARRGTIRTELKVEGADKGRQDIARFRRGAQEELTGVSRMYAQIRSNVTSLNQFRELGMATVGRITAAWAAAGRAALTVIQHNRDLTRAFSGLRSEADGIVTSFANGVAEGGNFTNTLDGIATATSRLATTANVLGRALDFAFDPQRITDFITFFSSAMNSNPLLSRLLAFALERGMRGLQEGPGGAVPLERIENEEFGSAPDTSARDAIRAAQARERELRQQRGRQRGGGGGRSAAADAARDARRMVEESERILDQQEEEDIRRWGEQWAERSRIEQEAADNSIRLWGDATMARNEFERAAHEQRMTWADEEKQQQAAIIEYQRERTRSIIGTVGEYANSVMTVGGAVADVFGQLAAEQAEGSKAAERYKKIQGGILAGIAFVNAAIEVAKAIGAYPDVVGIAAHAASAVAYIAAGALALRNLGGNASRPTTATGFTAAEKKPEATKATGGGTTIITLGATDGRLARELQRSANSAARSGLDRSMGGAGRYY